MGSRADAGGLAGRGSAAEGAQLETEASSWADEDPDAERAYQEARLSFLQWVIDPGAQAFAELEELQRSGQPTMSREALLARLTRDPEEATWLAEAQAGLGSLTDARYAQGCFLRGKFTRSLAEGAASLWNSRANASQAADSQLSPTSSSVADHGCTTNTGGSGCVSSHAGSCGARPSTAPPRPNAGSSSRQSAHSPGLRGSCEHLHGPGSSRSGGGQRRGGAGEAGGRNVVHRKPTHPLARQKAREAWRPHILAFVQEAVLQKPQVYLAQRLLTARATPDVVDTLTGLSVSLFGNQVLTEGIKAMEEREAAEKAFRAAVERAAQEERDRMEAEARVLDTVRWDSMNSSFKPPRGGMLSRALSIVVARGAQRDASRAVSRAISRAVSRRMSRAISAVEREEDGAAAEDAAMAQRVQKKLAASGKKLGGQSQKAAKGPRAAAAGGVRFGGEEVQQDTPARSSAAGAANADQQLERQDTQDTDAALVAAAAALVRATGHDVSSQQQQDQQPPGVGDADHAKSASFVASALVQPGALTSLPVSSTASRSAMLHRSASSRRRRSSRSSLHHSQAGDTSMRRVSLTQPGGISLAPPDHSFSSHCTATGGHADHHDPHHEHYHHHDYDLETANMRFRATSRAGALLGRDPLLQGSLAGDAKADSAETKWLGDDVKEALARPLSAHKPQVGRVSPPGLLTSRLKSQAYLELQDMLYPEKAKVARPVRLHEGVARPMTELQAGVEDVVTLGALRDAVDAALGFNKEAIQQELASAEHSVSAALPLSIKVATGDGGPHKTYRFTRDLLYDPRHMMMWQHVEGASYCQSLYGHYLLPNGKLAHFMLGDVVRKGHQVDLEKAPDLPFSPADWLTDGLPTTAAWAPWAVPMLGGPRSLQLLSPLWCPVPALGKPPAESVLEWEDGMRGGHLALTTICLSATLHTIERVEEEVITVAPSIKHHHKKKADAAAAAATDKASPGLSAAAAAAAAARPASGVRRS